MFFSNLYFADGIVYYKVMKHKISLSLEEFANILNLCHEGSVFKCEEKGDNFNFKLDASSLLKKLKITYSSQGKENSVT